MSGNGVQVHRGCVPTPRRGARIWPRIVGLAAVLTGCATADESPGGPDPVAVVLTGDPAATAAMEEILSRNPRVRMPGGQAEYSMRVVRPDPNVDYKLLSIPPGPGVDYKILRIAPNTTTEDRMPAAVADTGSGDSMPRVAPRTDPGYRITLMDPATGEILADLSGQLSDALRSRIRGVEAAPEE